MDNTIKQQQMKQLQLDFKKRLLIVETKETDVHHHCLRVWQEAESRTFNPEKTLIFEIRRINAPYFIE